jgi:hypothetical protein
VDHSECSGGVRKHEFREAIIYMFVFFSSGPHYYRNPKVNITDPATKY